MVTKEQALSEIRKDDSKCPLCLGTGLVMNYADKGVHVCPKCLKKMGDEQFGN